MEKTEFRFCEVRREGRALSGVAIAYGDTARVGARAERFLPGAFGDVSKLDVILNAQHDRSAPLARTHGGGLELDDSATALSVRATLPETRVADDILTLVESRVLRGFSIEFLAQRERLVGKTRELLAARLLNISVVDRPAYPQSTVAAREEVETPARRRELIL